MSEIRENRIWQWIWKMDCRSPIIPNDLTKIDGYGDPKAKFTRTKSPECMNYPTIIKDENGETTKTLWETDEQKAFIAQEIIRCYLTGYFCFIKGKLTWLSPWYYFFLNYWKVPVDTKDGLLEYRDAQNRILTYVWNVIHFTFCLGVVYLKGRRNFASAIGHAMAYIETTRGHNRHAGLSSSDEGLSDENFTEMFAGPVKELPLWFIPIHTLNQSSFVLREKGIQKSGAEMVSDALGGDVTIKGLTKRGFDGRRIHYLFGDESGKWKRVNVVKWIARQIKAMMAMGRRIGFAWIPTTAEEIEEGGKEFRQLFDDSDISTMRGGKYRTTKSKLLNLFIPAYDGWPGWIGPYGESIIDYPDDEQWEHMQLSNPDEAERIGAKAMLERDVEQALEEHDEEGAALLKREAPFEPSDAWTGLSANNPYEILKLQSLKKIVEENLPNWLMEGKVQRGYFDFEDKKTKTKPRWNQSDTGPVWISWHPSPDTIGQVRKIGGIKCPVNGTKGCLYLDTYSKTDKTKSKGSNQGLGGKLFYDRMYEQRNRDELARTGKNMEGYHPRPSIFMYFASRSIISGYDFEQVHAACLYYSMPVALENNRSTAFEIYMNQWGMRGFMLKEWEIKGDGPTADNEDTVGISTTAETNRDGSIGMGAQYHNEFLRGNAAFLGPDAYNILEQSIRYPFPEGIQDNLDLDMEDRQKSDYSMALNIGSYAEWNLCKYDEYFAHEQDNNGGRKIGSRAVYYRAVKPMIKKFR